MEADILLGHREAALERYFQLSAALLVCYEHALQLKNEVEFFWKRDWSFAKVLFLWSRYYSLGFCLANAIVFGNSRASPKFCINFFHWQNTGATMQYITTQVILQLRLYAMYERSKKLLLFFVLLTCSEISVMGVLFGVKKPGLIGTNEPFPGLYICADADPPHTHWMAHVPTTIVITETIFLTLALYKLWATRRAGTARSIILWLTRESVMYFVVIFCIHVANLGIWVNNRITLNESITGYSFAVPAVLANRMLISIRLYPQHLAESSAEPSHGAQTAQPDGQFTSVFEMDSYNLLSTASVQRQRGV